MSQNDKLLIDKGLPVLSKEERAELRGKWQAETWDDMLLSLNSYGKYIMLRPTGFGKTYTCAAACNIGHKSENGIVLNNESILNNKRLQNICNKKVIFVYVSEILKNTFDKYNQETVEIDEKTGEKKVTPPLILRDSNGNSRIQYETYTSVALHWNDIEYLKEKLDIKNVGLVIFDEVQRMGALETAKALEVALPILNELGIYYIGATATVERSTGYDVCDKYFRHDFDKDTHTYCWGEHIYTLDDTFKTGLLIPPEYVCITDDKSRIKMYRKELRQTKESMIAELKTMDANNTERHAIIENIKELEGAVIKNSSKIVHDTMINLYDCGDKYLTPDEELSDVGSTIIKRPEKLPLYMRFLVFTPNQAALKQVCEVNDEDGQAQVFGNMVARTYKDFHEAFGRYGYKIRTTIISSANSIEKNNVNLIDNTDKEEVARIEQLAAKKLKVKVRTEEDVELGKAVVPQNLVIDLIFSINMLNVGYHVNNITGLIFKRWTASNQIFLQQLGRCLSSMSDNIPVVFDYVNVFDSRGITAPLYTYDRKTNEVTVNADGTSNVTNDTKQTNKKTNTFNRIQLDNKGVMLPVGIDGNPVNPNTINNISAKYILVDTKSLSVDEIVSRSKVYQLRTTSKKLFEKAYGKYSLGVEIQGKKLVSNIHTIMNLDAALKLTLLDFDKNLANVKDLTINFKGFIEHLKNTSKELYIVYDILDDYIVNKGQCAKFTGATNEINSILAASKTVDNPNGATIKLLIDKNKIEEFKNNKEMTKLLKSKRFEPRTDLIYY